MPKPRAYKGKIKVKPKVKLAPKSNAAASSSTPKSREELEEKLETLTSIVDEQTREMKTALDEFHSQMVDNFTHFSVSGKWQYEIHDEILNQIELLITENELQSLEPGTFKLMKESIDYYVGSFRDLNNFEKQKQVVFGGYTKMNRMRQENGLDSLVIPFIINQRNVIPLKSANDIKGLASDQISYCLTGYDFVWNKNTTPYHQAMLLSTMLFPPSSDVSQNHDVHCVTDFANIINEYISKGRSSLKKQEINKTTEELYHKLIKTFEEDPHNMRDDDWADKWIDHLASMIDQTLNNSKNFKQFPDNELENLKQATEKLALIIEKEKFDTCQREIFFCITELNVERIGCNLEPFDVPFLVNSQSYSSLPKIKQISDISELTLDQLKAYLFGYKLDFDPEANEDTLKMLLMIALFPQCKHCELKEFESLSII